MILYKSAFAIAGLLPLMILPHHRRARLGGSLHCTQEEAGLKPEKISL